ncbi:MAG: hypothetical protein ACWGNP_04955, partial [Candidatus Bathyarchaeia archaeon]
GAGKFLTKYAIDYLKNRGAESVGLYAYPQLIKFYESIGFKTDIDFLVLKGNAEVPSTIQKEGMAAERLDIPKIVDFDCRHFGANRQKLLEAVLLDKDNMCCVSTEYSEVIGYVAAKVDGRMAELGPLMCDLNREVEAVCLLEAILSRLNGLDVFVVIPKKEKKLLNVLYKAEFKEDFRIVRMFLGSAFADDCICIAESLERG